MASIQESSLNATGFKARVQSHPQIILCFNPPQSKQEARHQEEKVWVQRLKPPIFTSQGKYILMQFISGVKVAQPLPDLLTVCEKWPE